MPKFMKQIFTLLIGIVLMSSCGQDQAELPESDGSNNWLIPQSELVFGTNKDAIRAVDEPNFVSISEIEYMEDDDLVQVLRLGEEIFAYTVNILDWHEIVNDVQGDEYLAITYCPLTGTGICWDREIEGTVTDFGVSGWLYNSNMIAFDRATDSYWSQMQRKCINGNYTGRSLAYHHMVEMSWAALKELFPEAKVLSLDTGFGLPYTDYPYYDYPTNNDFFVVPIEFDDQRYPAKEKMLGVDVLSEIKAYPFSAFPEDQITVVNDVFKGQPIVVIVHPAKQFITAYKANLEGKTYNFTAVQDEKSVVMMDDQGNKWNLLGLATEGPDQGESLKTVKAFTGYWFAWLEFFPLASVYE